MNRYLGAGGFLAIAFAATVAFWPGTATPPPIPSKRGCDLTMSPRGQLTRGVSGTALTLAFRSRACSTGTVTVAHGGVTQGTCTLSGGACTYSDTLPDLATTTVTGAIASAGVTHTDKLVAVVDSLNPELTIVSPQLAGDGSLQVVCGTVDANGCVCNSHVDAADPGYVADAYPGTDGGGHLVLTATVAGRPDGGTLSAAWNGVALASAPLTSATSTVTLSMTLPDQAIGTLTLTASIGSGSTALAIPVGVDVDAPPAPVESLYSDGGRVSAVTDYRHADMHFDFTIPPDSGPIAQTELWMATSTGLAQAGYLLQGNPSDGSWDGGIDICGVNPLTGLCTDAGLIVGLAYLVCHHLPGVYLVPDRGTYAHPPGFPPQ